MAYTKLLTLFERLKFLKFSISDGWNYENAVFMNPLMETDVESVPAYEPEHIAINNEHRNIVIELINQLPQNQKEALLLSTDGAPYKEIAETMNISLSNVKVLVKRGRDRLNL